MIKDYLSLLSIEEVSKFCFDNNILHNIYDFWQLPANANLFIPYEIIKYLEFKGYWSGPGMTSYAKRDFEFIREYVKLWKEI